MLYDLTGKYVSPESGLTLEKLNNAVKKASPWRNREREVSFDGSPMNYPNGFEIRAEMEVGLFVSPEPSYEVGFDEESERYYIKTNKKGIYLLLKKWESREGLRGIPFWLKYKFLKLKRFFR